MVKVAPEELSSLTGTCLVSAFSWVNSCFFLVGVASLAPGALVLTGCAAATVLKASFSAYTASLASPLMVRTPLLPGIFMRL